MVAVEAQATGAPVIALGRGGATETVVPIGNERGIAPTGIFFSEPTPESLVRAVQDFETVRRDFNPLASRSNAERFSPDAFTKGLTSVIDALI